MDPGALGGPPSPIARPTAVTIPAVASGALSGNTGAAAVAAAAAAAAGDAAGEEASVLTLGVSPWMRTAAPAALQPDPAAVAVAAAAAAYAAAAVANPVASAGARNADAVGLASADAAVTAATVAAVAAAAAATAVNASTAAAVNASSSPPRAAMVRFADVADVQSSEPDALAAVSSAAAATLAATATGAAPDGAAFTSLETGESPIDSPAMLTDGTMTANTTTTATMTTTTTSELASLAAMRSGGSERGTTPTAGRDRLVSAVSDALLSDVPRRAGAARAATHATLPTPISSATPATAAAAAAAVALAAAAAAAAPARGPGSAPLTFPVGFLPISRPGSTVPVTVSMPSTNAASGARHAAAPRVALPLHPGMPQTDAPSGRLLPSSHLAQSMLPAAGNPFLVSAASQQILAGATRVPVVLTQQDKEQKKRDRRESRRRNQRLEEEQQETDKEHREMTGRLLRVGMLCLPLVHLLELYYFRRELADRKNTDFIVLRNLGWAMVVAVVYLAIFLSWFITFQVSPDRFQSLNILNHNISRIPL